MREVLSLSYSPDAGLLVKIAAVKESEHVPGVMVRQLGVPEPQATISLDDLEPRHAEAFRALLATLPDIVDAKHAALAASPEKIAEEAAQLAAERHAYEAARKERAEEAARLDAGLAAKRAEVEAAEDAKRAREADLAALDERLAAKRAEAGAKMSPAEPVITPAVGDIVVLD